MKCSVYILQSKSTGKFYIGQTQNIDERLHRHNSGREKSTKKGAPWNLLCSVELPSRSEAVKLERKLKSLKSRKAVLKWIELNH